MTEQEKINSEVQMKLALQDAKFEAFMKRQDEMAADIRQINLRIDATNAKIDAKFDSLTNQLHNLTIAAVVGLGAIAVAVGGLVVAMFKRNF